MEIKIPGVRKLRERIERGNPLWAATQKPRLTTIMNNLLEALSQHATQSGMISVLGLLKSGKNAKRFRRRKSHSEVEANDEPCCKGSLNSVIFGVRKPGGRKAMKVRAAGVRKLRKIIERSDPLSAVTQVTSQCTTTNNLLKARTQHATQGGTMTKLGLLKSGKLMN